MCLYLFLIWSTRKNIQIEIFNMEESLFRLAYGLYVIVIKILR